MSFPRLIFLIPYRNRELHLRFFKKHMLTIMEDFDESEYQFFFVHQKDTRNFNRGGLKNIGFKIMKSMYPNNYKEITFVFNDIDTMPIAKNILDYITKKGVIKHFYGFNHTLGGIVSVNGEDFEKMNGFPNFWSWGYEDNELQKRAFSNKIIIDRSSFYPLFNENIIHLQHGFLRTKNNNETTIYSFGKMDGLKDISDLKYYIEEDMINVTYFNVPIQDSKSTKIIDLRNKKKETKMSLLFI